MWQGHDLKRPRPQIAGMLATVDRTGTNIPNIPKGITNPCCQQTCRQSDRGSNQPIGHGAVRAPG